MTKTVKAWAVIRKRTKRLRSVADYHASVYLLERSAEGVLYANEDVVPCTITYEVSAQQRKGRVA